MIWIPTPNTVNHTKTRIMIITILITTSTSHDPHHHHWMLIGFEDRGQIARWHSSTLNTKYLFQNWSQRWEGCPCNSFGFSKTEIRISQQIEAKWLRWADKTSWIFPAAPLLLAPPVYGSWGATGGRLYWLYPCNHYPRHQIETKQVSPARTFNNEWAQE